VSFQPRFIEHGGVRILELDYSGLAPAELPPAFDEAGRVIAAEPPASVRILTILDSQFDAAAADALKRYAAGNRPYVRASAVVARGFWSAVVITLKLGERKDLVIFRDTATALDYLARS